MDERQNTAKTDKINERYVNNLEYVRKLEKEGSAVIIPSKKGKFAFVTDGKYYKADIIDAHSAMRSDKKYNEDEIIHMALQIKNGTKKDIYLLGSVMRNMYDDANTIIKRNALHEIQKQNPFWKYTTTKEQIEQHMKPLEIGMAEEIVRKYYIPKSNPDRAEISEGVYLKYKEEAQKAKEKEKEVQKLIARKIVRQYVPKADAKDRRAFDYVKIRSIQ